MFLGLKKSYNAEFQGYTSTIIYYYISQHNICKYMYINCTFFAAQLRVLVIWYLIFYIKYSYFQ